MNRYLQKNTTLLLTKNKLFKPVVWFQACFFFHIRGLAAKTTYVIRNFRRFDNYTLTTVSFSHYHEILFGLTGFNSHVTFTLVRSFIRSTHGLVGGRAFSWTLAFSGVVINNTILVRFTLMERACV